MSDITTIPVTRGRFTSAAQRHPLTMFFLLAIGITWLVWIPRALASVGILDSALPAAIGRVWSYGPLIGASAAAALTGGRSAVRALGLRLVRWRVAPWWYAVVLIGPALMWIIAAGAYVASGGSLANARPAAVAVGPQAFLPVLLALIFTDGLGEEAAWRGYALPLLLRRYTALTASVSLGIFWALYHLPLVWTEGASMYRTPFLWLFVDLPVTALLYTWVFKHTQGSVLLAVLLHGALNIWAISMPSNGTGDLKAYLAGLASRSIAALLVIAVFGRQLTRHPTAG